MDDFQDHSKEIHVFVAEFAPKAPVPEDKLAMSLSWELINLKYFPGRCFAWD